jgi:hypothetical protein
MENLTNWPAITCLCPTYGRFERLRDAVACFLLQDYPGEKELLVLNDAPREISVRAGYALGQIVWWSPQWHIAVNNVPLRLETLGHKRQALLQAAQTPLVAHWDDDDIYLPWHLSQTVASLPAHPMATCAKPGAAWFVIGPRQGPFQCRGIHHNVFEGQMIFYRERALDLDGYPPMDSGQAKALLDAFRCAGELHEWNPADAEVSCIVRWGDGVDHVSARKAPTQDTDFGRGEPLIPAAVQDPRTWAAERLQPVFRALAEGPNGPLPLMAWLTGMAGKEAGPRQVAIH